MPPKIPLPKNSIFLKLSLVIIASGIFISLAFVQGFMLSTRPKFDPSIRLNVHQYIKYLINDFGKPPQFEKGKQLAEDLGLHIRIEGEGWSWASSDDVPSISEYEQKRPGPPTPPPQRFFPRLPRTEPHFELVEHTFPFGRAKVLVIGKKRVFEANYALLFFLIGFIGFILLMSHLIIRKILNPLNTLSTGVATISHGNLNHVVPVKSQDELGALAAAFNSMVLKIKEMISSKKQLLLDVSHELRTPLTRAKVGLELLDENKVTEQIHRDLNELEEMITTILEDARFDSTNCQLSRSEADLSSLVNSVVEEYSQFGKPVLMEKRASAVLIYLDATRIKSVLRNLIDNSLKYSPEGKPVSVVVTEEDKSVRIEIRDQGIGIAADEQEKVFEPFYRIDRSRARTTGGYGLGLSLCKKIVDAHGGTIGLKSELGKGTTVTVILPHTRKAA